VTSSKKRFRPAIPPTAQAGFSLLELLIVAALMMVMASLYFNPGARDRQRELKAACHKNMQKTYVALQIYATDFGGKFPAVTGAQSSREPLTLLVPRYTSDTSLFVCPGSQEASLLGGKYSYAYYMGRHATDAGQPLMSDRQVDTTAKAAGQPVFSKDGKPPGNNHDRYGGNFLFTDGHVEPSPAKAAFPLPLTNGVVLLNP
jgi:prepilin-type N-terminal cleavage/methylation domain-containing protein/prepilin-type processing-associated H-X9-DG protein